MGILIIILGFLFCAVSIALFLFNLIERFGYLNTKQKSIRIFICISSLLFGIYIMILGNNIMEETEYKQFIAKYPDTKIMEVTKYNTQPISQLDNTKYKNYQIDEYTKYKQYYYIAITTESGSKIIKFKKDLVYYIDNTIDDLNNITVDISNNAMSTRVYVQNIADIYHADKKNRKKLLLKEETDSTNNITDLIDNNSDYIEEFKKVDTSAMYEEDYLKELVKDKYNIFDKYGIKRIRFK